MDLDSEFWDQLLPPKERLPPVSTYYTFGECGFTDGTFTDLPTQTQLRIAKDIIRQAILVDFAPTLADEEILSGDCVTAAKFLVAYVKKLGIPGEYRVASVRRNPFDPEWRTCTRHVIVLRREPNKDLYQIIDPCPMVGYAFNTISGLCYFDGHKVTRVDRQDFLPYDEISVLSDDDLEVITQINIARKGYLDGTFAIRETEELLSKCGLLPKTAPHLNAWVAELYYNLAQLYLTAGRITEFEEAVNQTVQLKPLKSKILRLGESVPFSARNKVASAFTEYQKLLGVQANQFSRRARVLFASGDPHRYPEALGYLQWATQVAVIAGTSGKRSPVININGKATDVRLLNPRTLGKHTTCWIKPSAYFIKKADAARIRISSAGDIVWEEGINLSEARGNGYLPIIASHPQGKRNLQDYFGPTTVYLVKAERSVIEEGKKAFRAENNGYAGEIACWFDGKPNTWNLWTMNHIHSTDKGAETLVHLLLNYPEFCLINRWSYPHPNL